MNKRKVLSILLLALITVTLAVSCSSNIDTPAANTEELAYVTFGNGHSRELNTSYQTEPYNLLYWFYTAQKTDSYGTTGETSGITPVSKNTSGNHIQGLSGRVGPFSQGAWKFKLYAYGYTKIEEDTSVRYEIDSSKLVYESDVVYVTLKGGDVKNVPVSVGLKGDYGKVSISDVKFFWANGGGTDSPLASLSFVGSNSSNNFTVPATLTYEVATSDTRAHFKLSDQEIKFSDGTKNIPADYYTVTAKVYLPNSEDTPLVTQTFGLRVYGNTTTVITGDLTEGIDSYVLFDVAKQDMKVFVPNADGSVNIQRIEVTPSGVEGKETTVKFETDALSAYADKTLQLDVKVTTVEAANNKFNISGTISENKSAFAGIDVTLTDSTGTNEVAFANGKYATVTTYIAKDLSDVVVKYNGTGKSEPIATDATGDGVVTNAAKILTSDTDTSLGYNPTTGLLRFKTNHFSEYYVLAKCEALNVNTGVPYTSLATAIADAKDGQEVKLMSNVNVNKTIDVDKGIVINLNEKNITGNNVRTLHFTNGSSTITGSGTVSSNVNDVGSSVIRIGYGNSNLWSETTSNKNISLVIDSNVTISTPTCYGITVMGASNEKLEVKGTIISTAPYNNPDHDGCAVSTNGSDKTVSTIIIHDGATLSAANTNAIYMPSGNLIVNGGEITGLTGIYVKAGNTTILGGTVTGTGVQKDYKYWGNGGISTGDALVVDSCNYPNAVPVVSVEGGEFTSNYNKAVGSYHGNGATEYVTGFISGGTFSSNPSDYVPFGYDVKQVDGKYVVSKSAELTVDNADQLMKFAASVNAGNDYAGKTIILNRDIDLNTEEWTPIGQKAGNKFAGVFDGNNKTISGLSITENNIAVTDTAFDKYVGLFGAIENGTVKNLTVSGSVTGINAAGIVARMESGTIENCISNVTVVGTDNGKAGGIVCLTNTGNCTIKNCINNGSVKGDTEAGVGGIAAYVNANTTIYGCTNNAEIGSNTDRYSGGIAGYVKGSDNILIKNCTNTNNVTAYEEAGGIVGIITKGDEKTPNITNCLNRGAINARQNGNGGGIAGSTYKSILTDCKNTASVYGKYAGGVIGNDAASTITNCSGGTADITSPAHTITFTDHSFTLSVDVNKSSGRIIGAHMGAGPGTYTVIILDDTNGDSKAIPTVGICGNFTTMPILKISSGTFYGDPLAGNRSTIILESGAKWGERAAGTYTRGGVDESSPRIEVWTISNN